VAAGIAALLLVPACGLVVVSKAPPGHVSLEAPALVQPDPAVEAAPAQVATVSVARATLQARRAALRIRNTACDGVRSGSGFALDPTLLIADQEVLPGAAALKLAHRKGAATPADASRVYRLGELAVAHVASRLPRAPAGKATTSSGASVAVVGYPLAPAPRLLPGVVVDTVAGAPFGVRGRVLRLTSALRDGDPGGPVIDAGGRIVAVAFTTDPRTGFAVAAPIATLRSLVAAHALEALPPCDGT
jgi:hypothetical protein